MALPIVTGSVYCAGVKIHETRIIRLWPRIVDG
jgi:hypothetical protein